MGDDGYTQKQLAEQLDAMLVTIDKLRDQVITVKRKVEGVNPVRECLAFYDELWVNLYARGAKPVVHYDFNRNVDPATVKRWLKTMDAATLKGRITRYFADHDSFVVRNKHPFNLFIKSFNAYVPPANLPPAAAGAPSMDPIADCFHQPACATDAEHTAKRQREMRTAE